jgi:hypothetical protein
MSWHTQWNRQPIIDKIYFTAESNKPVRSESKGLFFIRHWFSYSDICARVEDIDSIAEWVAENHAIWNHLPDTMRWMPFHKKVL